MYSIPHSQQLLIFLFSLGIGFILGIFYDILRAVRLSITKSPKAHIFFDILYFLTFAIVSYIYILASNKGAIRFYILAGELIGLCFYYFSFGIAVIKITDVAVKLIRGLFSLCFLVISFPFKMLKRFFCHIKTLFLNISKKTEKKSSKMRKKVLQNSRLYVYNLFGEFFARKERSRKDGKDNGKEKASKKAQ